MAVFHLENNVVKVAPELLNIPEFKVIWDRDKSKDKGVAYKEIFYIYFTTDYKSVYNAYPEHEREARVIKDFIRDDKWIPDDEIKAACIKYDELQVTPTLRLLQSARTATDKLSQFFLIQDPEHKNYTSNLEKLGRLIESMDKLEEKVKKEQTNSNRVRGGGEARTREK